MRHIVEIKSPLPVGCRHAACAKCGSKPANSQLCVIGRPSAAGASRASRCPCGRPARHNRRDRCRRSVTPGLGPPATTRQTRPRKTEHKAWRTLPSQVTDLNLVAAHARRDGGIPYLRSRLSMANRACATGSGRTRAKIGWGRPVPSCPGPACRRDSIASTPTATSNRGSPAGNGTL